MAIRFVSDLGAPVAVTAVDLITEATQPTWNEWAAYVLALGGYVGAFMGWGGDFTKNIGIASFPWAAKKIYERVTVGRTSTKLSLRRAGIKRLPAPPFEPQYEGAALT